MANRMNSSRRARAIAAMTERSIAEAMKGSTAERFAISQKAVEAFVRDFWYDGGLRSESDFRARTAGKADLIMFGRRAEVKSGGTVGIPESASWDENDVMPDAHFVVFPLMDEITCADDVPDNTLVMERSAFIEIAATCSRKGLAGVFHVTSRGVLAFQPTPLRKLRDTLLFLLMIGKLPTLRTFKEERE